MNATSRPSWGACVWEVTPSVSSALALWRGLHLMAAAPPLELGDSVLHYYVPLIFVDDVGFAGRRARRSRSSPARCGRIIAALVVLPLLVDTVALEVRPVAGCVGRGRIIVNLY